LHTLSNGETKEVTTLYIGLSQAFYLTTNDAGCGEPSANGWVWKSKPELANTVRKAVNAVQDNSANARPVELPLTLKNDLQR